MYETNAPDFNDMGIDSMGRMCTSVAPTQL
jgi:hypothetical protein